MKNKKNILLYVAIALSVVLMDLFAAGTPAGTIIQSRSRVTFTSRSSAMIDTVYSAFVSIIVAQKAAINITPVSNTMLTQSDSTSADYPVTVTNSGNGSDGIRFSTLSTKAWSSQIYRDANSDGVLQSDEISAGTIAQTPNIGSDGSVAIVVRVIIPRDESLNGQTDTTTLIVKSVFDSTTVNTGKYSTTVRTTGMDMLHPGLSVNNQSPIAGQEIVYSMTITNAGSVQAKNISILNAIPSGCAVVSGSTSIGTFNGSANPIIWTIGTLSPSQSVTITATMRISASVLSGTVISNVVEIHYSAGANSYLVNSNTVPVTVSGVLEFGVEIIPAINAQTKDAADSIWYRYTIRNIGSFKDIFELATTSTQHLEWMLYRDNNNNGLWDRSDVALINSNDSGGVDSDSLAVGDSIRIFASTSIPVFETDLEQDTLKVIAVSAGDHSKYDEGSAVTTVRSPVILLEKSMLPAGDQPAGSILTYMIKYSNLGSVAVSSFSIADIVPKQTTYVRNSITVNGIAAADDGGVVTIASDDNNNTVITVSIGTLAATTNGSVEFKVKIK
ncbi:MAG: DUF11 domain-containing protein [Bacteroidetes bacterium]|nr:DUF11 domain-containing protein [Bacteroidota bacterium]